MQHSTHNQMRHCVTESCGCRRKSIIRDVRHTHEAGVPPTLSQASPAFNWTRQLAPVRRTDNRSGIAATVPVAFALRSPGEFHTRACAPPRPLGVADSHDVCRLHKTLRLRGTRRPFLCTLSFALSLSFSPVRSYALCLSVSERFQHAPVSERSGPLPTQRTHVAPTRTYTTIVTGRRRRCRFVFAGLHCAPFALVSRRPKPPTFCPCPRHRSVRYALLCSSSMASQPAALVLHWSFHRPRSIPLSLSSSLRQGRHERGPCATLHSFSQRQATPSAQCPPPPFSGPGAPRTLSTSAVGLLQNTLYCALHYGFHPLRVCVCSLALC